MDHHGTQTGPEGHANGVEEVENGASGGADSTKGEGKEPSLSDLVAIL